MLNRKCEHHKSCGQYNPKGATCRSLNAENGFCGRYRELEAEKKSSGSASKLHVGYKQGFLLVTSVLIAILTVSFVIIPALGNSSQATILGGADNGNIFGSVQLDELNFTSGFSASGTFAAQNITSSTGALLQPAAYVIYKIGLYTIAKNGTSGAIAFNSTDPYTVIQSAVNNAPTYGTVLIRKNGFSMTNTLMLNKSVNLIGENEKGNLATYLTTTLDIPLVNITANYVALKSIGITSNTNSYSKGALVIQPATGTTITDLTVANVEIYRARTLTTAYSGYGLEIMANKGSLMFATFKDMYIKSGFQYHIYIYANGTGKYANGNLFDNVILDLPTRGIQFDPRNSAVINSNLFSNLRIQSANDGYGVTEWGINISGVANELQNVKMWDTPANKGTVRITSSSTDTLISGGALNNITDAGTRTRITDVYGADTSKSGVSSKSNGQTISHGLEFTPTYASCTATNSSNFCSVTAITSTTITIGLRDYNGVAVAVAENVYWEARYQP